MQEMSEKADNRLAGAAKKSFAAPFGAVLKIAPEARPPLWIDGRADPPAVSGEAPKDADAACIWRGAEDSLIRALNNDRAFESSYVSGRITVSGDMSVMARLHLGAKK